MYIHSTAYALRNRMEWNEPIKYYTMQMCVYNIHVIHMKFSYKVKFKSRRNQIQLSYPRNEWWNQFKFICLRNVCREMLPWLRRKRVRRERACIFTACEALNLQLDPILLTFLLDIRFYLAVNFIQWQFLVGFVCVSVCSVCLHLLRQFGVCGKTVCFAVLAHDTIQNRHDRTQ